MVKSVYKQNAAHIEADMKWLGEILKRRYESYHRQPSGGSDFRMPIMPQLKGNSVYKSLLTQFKLTAAERMVLLISLVPHIAPYFFETAWLALGEKAGSKSKNSNTSAMLPAVDLVFFLLAGDELEKRFFYQQIFDEDSFLMQHKIIMLEQEASGLMNLQYIRISPEYLSLLTNGKQYKPRFSTSFPAKRISTLLDWDDLVLNPYIKDQVAEISLWIKHGNTILVEWGLGKRLSPGYKVLFYGPPGTGKTLTASLIGKEAGTDVYRIDLSMVVSKYIGETEKNLSRIFDEADRKNWILFFDEADALFGKRTEMKDAHDRYANQEVAFLLQKIEDHNGVVILSSNMKSNIDEAFTRRFQNIIHFPMPVNTERLLLWKNGFSGKSILGKNILLDQIAEKYEMSGGAIMNVIRYASLKALQRKKNIVELTDIINGIAREFSKEGRTI
jgi:hypothetical protein